MSLSREKTMSTKTSIPRKACFEADSLEQAALMMWECDVGYVVVIDEKSQPVGIITDRDVAMAYSEGTPLQNVRVGAAMSRSPITCSQNATLAEVENLMQGANIRRLPVVDPEGQLIGIITLSNIATTPALPA